MSDFYPISPLVGITNTSYGAQAGVLNEMWAVRVVHGRKIIAEKPIPSLELDNIVGVAYGHIRVEGLSRHAVATMAGRLMQYARKYQQSGVCPNYELADFTFDDGSSVDAQASPSGGASESTPPEAAPTATLRDLKVAEVPQIPRTIGDAAWLRLIEAHAALIFEVSVYAKSLPAGHLESMFSRAADQLIHFWVTSNPDDRSAMLKRFGALIQSCSKESQLPKTGTSSATIETGACELLRICKLLDPNMSMMPAGYPCTFHEMIARKISDLSGIKVSVNTSSTGCIVGMSIESSVF